MLASRSALKNDWSTNQILLVFPPLFQFHMQSLHIYSTELHKKYVPALSVAPIISFQNLVKVEVKLQLPVSHSLGWDFPWNSQGLNQGSGHWTCTHTSVGYSLMDAHHLLAWWDCGFILTHISAISKWKATLNVLSGASTGLTGTPDLDLEVGTAVSQEPGKIFSTNYCTAGWNSQGNDCCNWRVCAAEQHFTTWYISLGNTVEM